MRVKIISLFILISTILMACGTSTPQATATPIPTDTPTPLPTLTATPTIPLAVLVVPANMDADLSNLYQKTVYDLAQASGMRYQVRNTLTAADLEPGLKIVIAFPPDPGIAALAAAAPQVQFLAINIPGLTAGGNISLLGGNSQRDIPAFLAGYVAAMITDDYRVGMIIPKDNNDAARAYNAFSNGMTFYCGSCRPFYYLTWSFPQYIEIPADEDKAKYGGYANYLITDRKVNTLYIYADVADADFLNYVGTTGAYIIGTISPNPRPAGWVMTIQPDIVKAIQTAWPDLLAGQGGIDVQSPLGIGDIDPTILTPGKQRLAQQTLDDLQAGRINTGVNP